METLLTTPALTSADDTVRFIDEVFAQAQPLRAQMQDADAEITRLAMETQSLRAESVRLQTRQEQSARDMAAALDSLAALNAPR
jgi:hypothetical protein